MRDLKNQNCVFAQLYGLSIYEYLVKKCENNAYVKLNDLFLDYLHIADNQSNRRAFRHYREWLDELYIEEVLEYCFDHSTHGLHLTTGHERSKKLSIEAKKKFKQAKRFRKAADSRYQGKIIFRGSDRICQH